MKHSTGSSASRGSGQRIVFRIGNATVTVPQR